jgi:CheY-like chemotaxis protein
MRYILYAEDDPDDFEILKQSMFQVDEDMNIIQVPNGQEAINHLKRHIDHPPCLIILDINMPMMDGRQAIRLIKEDDLLQHIPMVAFTTSTNPMDKLLCQKLKVDCLSKPNSIPDMEKMVNQLLHYCHIS